MENELKGFVLVIYHHAAKLNPHNSLLVIVKF
jgi:hypothetical protein